jgi:hypothetical protein
MIFFYFLMFSAYSLFYFIVFPVLPSEDDNLILATNMIYLLTLFLSIVCVFKDPGTIRNDASIDFLELLD